MKITRKKLEALSMLPIILRDVREAAGISQADIARILGVSRQYIAKFENGQSTPSKEQLERWLERVNSEIAVSRVISESVDKLRTNLSQLSLPGAEHLVGHKKSMNRLPKGGR